MNKYAPYNVFTICGYIIQQSVDKDFILSNLTLQPILYFLQAAFLVNRNTVCFSDRIEAWGCGPIVLSAHNYYKKHAGLMIPAKEADGRYIDETIFSEGKYIPNNVSAISKEDKELIDSVIDKVKLCSASYLNGVIFKQKPWIDAYGRHGDNEIKVLSMKKFFKRRTNRMNKYAEYVLKTLDDRELLEALAEEAAELSQAALKLIRASKLNDNFTPKSDAEAEENLKEELMDTLSVVYLLRYRVPTENEVDNYHKWERWAKRLGYVEI